MRPEDVASFTADLVSLTSQCVLAGIVDDGGAI